MMPNEEKKLQAFTHLVSALDFYASSETYTGVLVMGDPPCGDFVDDISDPPKQEDFTLDRPVPGKRAREALATTVSLLGVEYCTLLSSRVNKLEEKSEKET